MLETLSTFLKAGQELKKDKGIKGKKKEIVQVRRLQESTIDS
jgi:hypothetical protein